MFLSRSLWRKLRYHVHQMAPSAQKRSRLMRGALPSDGHSFGQLSASDRLLLTIQSERKAKSVSSLMHKSQVRRETVTAATDVIAFTLVRLLCCNRSLIYDVVAGWLTIACAELPQPGFNRACVLESANNGGGAIPQNAACLRSLRLLATQTAAQCQLFIVFFSVVQHVFCSMSRSNCRC